MKQNYFVALLILLLLPLAGQAQRRNMKTFTHLSASVEAGTTGFGVQVATSLTPNIALRSGISILPFNYSYTYDGYGDGEFVQEFSIPLKAKIDMFNGKILFDLYPKRDSRFHFTVGAFIGNSKVIKVKGHTDLDLSNEYIEIGDIWVRPDEFGNVSAWIKTNTIKPYVGIGLGRTIPRKRIGFKFELGAMFQGAPKVGTHNVMLDELDWQEPEDDLNKFLNDYFKVYPYMSFQLTYKIFGKNF